MSLSFDIGRADDLPQLVELLGILFTQEHELAPDAAKQLRGLKMIVEHPVVGCIYVAREGASVIGSVSILRTISTAEGGPVGMLEDFVVRPGRRGKGLGAQLLAYAVGRAKADGLLRLILLTDGDNVNAQRLYERAGFKRSGMLPMRLKL
jgi:GNAT superfamily N-acetyltransferase